MGEAKQRWYRQRLAPCVCGTRKLAKDCCWTPNGWFKPPVPIELVNTGNNSSNARCYLRALNSCSDKISGEHMISRTVLESLGKDKVRVSGVPWMKAGEAKEIGINSLVSNCLCEAHNHALSPLDAAAGHFYRTLEDCLLDDNMVAGTHLFSGHDVERWLLKVTVGLAASKYLASEREVLPGLFVGGINVADLLQHPDAWRTPMGMYVMQKLGDTIQPRGELAVAPLASETKEIGGLMTQIQGFTIVLLLKQAENVKGSSLEHAPYRIEKMNFNQPNGLRVLQLSWFRRYST